MEEEKPYLSAIDWYSLRDRSADWAEGSVGRGSPSLILVGSGCSTTSTGVFGVEAGEEAAAGVEVFFFDVCCAGDDALVVASETRRFAAGSRRSRAESLRFSAMGGDHDWLSRDTNIRKPIE